MIALQTREQLGLHLERLFHESLVKEVEKLANECYHISLNQDLNCNVMHMCE